MVTRKKTVAVALSGGLDSSCAAIILEEQGWDLMGVHLVLPVDNREEKMRRVKLLADHVHIDVHFLDVRESFQENVIDYFYNSYNLGLTPNPCVVCNYAIKFDKIIGWMDHVNIDYLATGHYARLERNKDKEDITLMRAKDRQKDQTYFLHRVRKSHLSRSLFPLGNMRKAEMYGYAKERGLPEQAPNESQEVCFIPDNDYRSYFRNHEDSRIFSQGNIIDREGNVVGIHPGTYAYTIGQRHGLGISSPYPLYVYRIKPETNEIVVAKRQDLFGKELIAKDFLWLKEPLDKKKFRLKGQIRYRHKASSGTLTIVEKDLVHFEFDYPQWAITPGQALVCYESERVIGGGWITRTERSGLES